MSHDWRRINTFLLQITVSTLPWKWYYNDNLIIVLKPRKTRYHRTSFNRLLYLPSSTSLTCNPTMLMRYTIILSRFKIILVSSERLTMRTVTSISSFKKKNHVFSIGNMIWITQITYSSLDRLFLVCHMIMSQRVIIIYKQFNLSGRLIWSFTKCIKQRLEVW